MPLIEVYNAGEYADKVAIEKAIVESYVEYQISEEDVVGEFAITVCFCGDCVINPTTKPIYVFLNYSDSCDFGTQQRICERIKASLKVAARKRIIKVWVRSF